MAVLERATVVDAPFEDVWAFHSRIEELETVTPEWLRLRIESVRSPEGMPDPDRLVPGTTIRISVQPGGRGPRQAWSSRIVGRNRSDTRASFTDVMIDGPFPRWRHTHRFIGQNGTTRIIDRVEYELPIGPFRRWSGIANPVLAILFADRHRRTRRELE